MDSQVAGPQGQASFDLEQFKDLYRTFDSQTLARLPELYNSAIVFKDPIHQLHDLKSFTRYLANFCQPETKCQFEYVNEIATNNQAFLHWKMHYSHPKLGGGKTQTLNGATLIKFESKVFYHEDFYDMGAMIYQHLPVVGWAVKKINKHMAEH